MAAITRLSLDGYGAKRVGSFAGKEAGAEPEPEVEVAVVAAGYRFRPGYIRPRKLKRRQEPPTVVEIGFDETEAQVKYVSVQEPVVFGPSMEPIMDAVERVSKLIEARTKAVELKRTIEELEEEEDILFIVRHLQ